MHNLIDEAFVNVFLIEFEPTTPIFRASGLPTWHSRELNLTSEYKFQLEDAFSSNFIKTYSVKVIFIFYLLFCGPYDLTFCISTYFMNLKKFCCIHTVFTLIAQLSKRMLISKNHHSFVSLNSLFFKSWGYKLYLVISRNLYRLLIDHRHKILDYEFFFISWKHFANLLLLRANIIYRWYKQQLFDLSLRAIYNAYKKSRDLTKQSDYWNLSTGIAEVFSYFVIILCLRLFI